MRRRPAAAGQTDVDFCRGRVSMEKGPEGIQGTPIFPSSSLFLSRGALDAGERRANLKKRLGSVGDVTLRRGRTAFPYVFLDAARVTPDQSISFGG